MSQTAVRTVQTEPCSNPTSKRCSAGYQIFGDHCLTAQSTCGKGKFDGPEHQSGLYYGTLDTFLFKIQKWDSIRTETVIGYLLHCTAHAVLLLLSFTLRARRRILSCFCRVVQNMTM